MTIVGLCVAAISCFVTTLDTDLEAYDALSTVHILEKSIELHLLKLRYRRDQLEIYREKDLREIMDYTLLYSVNSALNNIRKAVNVGKAEGRNAEPCYTAAYTSLFNDSMQMFDNEINVCLKNFRKVFQEEYEPIKELIEKFEHELNELRELTMTCMYFGDFAKNHESEARTCVYEQESKIENASKMFEEEMSTIKMEGKSSYSSAVETFQKCIQPYEKSLRHIAVQTENQGIQCAKNSDTNT